MKKIIPFLMSLLMLAGCAVQPAGEATYRQIDMDQAISLMETESNYIIVDVRTLAEYNERHIPEAVNIPNDNIGSEEITELPDKQQLILVSCRSGNRSKQAAQTLADMGYTNVVEFGGINDWSGETVSGE